MNKYFFLLPVLFMLFSCATTKIKNDDNNYLEVVKNGQKYEKLQFVFDTNQKVREVSKHNFMFNETSDIKYEYLKSNLISIEYKTGKVVEKYYFDLNKYTTWKENQPNRIYPLEKSNDMYLIDIPFCDEKNQVIFIIMTWYNFDERKLHYRLQLYKRENLIENYPNKLVLKDHQNNRYEISYAFIDPSNLVVNNN
jgi:hypothetical protein